MRLICTLFDALWFALICSWPYTSMAYAYRPAIQKGVHHFVCLRITCMFGCLYASWFVVCLHFIGTNVTWKLFLLFTLSCFYIFCCWVLGILRFYFHKEIGSQKNHIRPSMMSVTLPKTLPLAFVHFKFYKFLMNFASIRQQFIHNIDWAIATPNNIDTLSIIDDTIYDLNASAFVLHHHAKWTNIEK